MTRKFLTPVELPGLPQLPTHAVPKAYIDSEVADKANLPWTGPVPAGATTVVISHDLNSTDVDLTVWLTSNGNRVGVPYAATGPSTVELYFAAAPVTGQYRALISPGGGSGSAGGGGGVAVAHAAAHAANGSDPITPESIGAAPTVHNHDQLYSTTAHRHDDLYQPVGAYAGAFHTHDGAYAPASHNHSGGGNLASVKPFSPSLVLSRRNVAGYPYPAIDMDCSESTHFRIDLTGDAFLAPFNATDGQIMLIEVRAYCYGVSGIQRNLYLGGDTNEPIEFPIGITQTPTLGACADYITLIYDARGSARFPGGTFRVMSWVKNHLFEQNALPS